MALPLLGSKSRVLLLLLIIIVLLCIDTVLIPEKRALADFYHATGFYLILATFLLWLFLVWPRRLDRHAAGSFLQTHGLVIILIIVLVGAMFLASPLRFRILADETNLLGVAAAMYDSRDFFNQTQGLYYYGAFHETGHVWEIRPIFFPFLIYLVHAVTGYSSYNGFVVNAIAGALSLWCFYWLLLRFFSRSLALAGMVCLAAFPVFVLWVTSSGFEIVNLLFALAAFCFLYRFLHGGDPLDLERVVVTLALLAQARYESAVFAAAFLVAILLVRRLDYLEKLSWRCLLWPVLFLPVFWQRFLKNVKSDYQVDADSPVFSSEYFLTHLQTLPDYFLASEERYGTIAPIAILALAGLVIGLARLYRNHGRLMPELTGLLWALFFSVVLLLLAILSYYWGDLTASFTIRLGIIFLPVIILLALVAVDFLAGYCQSIRQMAVLASVALVLLYWPVAGRNEAVGKLKLYQQYQSALAFLEKNYPGRNIVIITDRPGMYSVHRWGAVKFDYANNDLQKLQGDLQKKRYQDVLVIQQVSLADGTVSPGMELDESYRLKILYESQTEAEAKLRISRVVLPVEQ